MVVSPTAARDHRRDSIGAWQLPPLRRVRRRSTSIGISMKETNHMIVIGADTHKASHALVAVDGGTGQVLSEREIPCG